MVKALFVLILFLGALFAEDTQELLTQKIQQLITKKVYDENKDFIKIIFTPKSAFYNGEHLDSVKVARTLKENSLLRFRFSSPKKLTLHFKTSSSPVLFVKIMQDALRNIGYYRYVTQGSSFDNSEFVWTLSLNSKHIADPALLQKELSRSYAKITDISRESSTQWSYTIDIEDARLNVKKLDSSKELVLKRSLDSKWVDVSDVEGVVISSSIRNTWYPYIAFYDKFLNLIKVFTDESKTSKISLKFDENVYYIKISDIYTMKNLRDNLILNSTASR